MRQLLAGKLISRIDQSFLQRLELWAPHVKEIKATWRRLLDRLALDRSELQALSRLEIENLYERLRSADFHAYELALERQGQTLAKNNVPEEYAIAALGFLYEACLPFVLGENPKDKQHALTLAQVISAGQVCLVSGYANHRAASWWTMEEKLRKAEQHVHGLATHITEAYETERRRLSRDLHDEVGHDLAVLKLYLELLNADAKKGKVGEVVQKLEEALGLIGKSIEAVRRLSFDLGPGIFDELGFVASTKFYARRFTMRTGIQVRVREALASFEPSTPAKMVFYRVLQGALANVLHHSRAKEVKVNLKKTDESLLMTVEDDGRGFNVQRKLRDPRRSFGLLAMRERVELLAGNLQIVSPAVRSRNGKKRAGTRVEVILPVPKEETR